MTVPVKYHIKPASGEPGRCYAKAGNCPFGADAPHFATAEEARKSFESSMAEKTAKITNNEAAHKGLDGYTVTGFFMNPSAVREGDRFVNEYGSVFEALEGAYFPADFSIPSVKLGVVDPETGKVIRGAGSLKVSMDQNSPQNRPNAFRDLLDNNLKDLDTISDAELGKRLANVLNRWQDDRREGSRVGNPADILSGQKVANTLRRTMAVRGNRAQQDYITGDQKTGPVFSYSVRRDLSNKPYKNYVKGIPGQSESKALKDFPKGETIYPKAVKGDITYLDEDKKPQSLSIVMPYSGNLTGKKKIDAARQLWSLTGEDPQKFEDVSDYEKERWFNTRFGRYNDLKIERDGDYVSYSHDNGSGSRDSDKFKLIEI